MIVLLDEVNFRLSLAGNVSRTADALPMKIVPQFERTFCPLISTLAYLFPAYAL